MCRHVLALAIKWLPEKAENKKQATMLQHIHKTTIADGEH